MKNTESAVTHRLLVAPKAARFASPSLLALAVRRPRFPVVASREARHLVATPDEHFKRNAVVNRLSEYGSAFHHPLEHSVELHPLQCRKAPQKPHDIRERHRPQPEKP